VNRSHLLKLSLLATAYLLSGELGLLLAIPPGYATAVWPPSGVALAALLLYGRGLWPGILLGSFLINLGTSLAPQSLASTAQSITIALAIGGGAVLQAVVGSWLIERFIGSDHSLLNARSAIAFLGLGGPLSCVISPLFGVGTLWLAGLVDSTQFIYIIATWWVGDAIGVLVFVPLIYILLGQPRQVWRWRRTRMLPTLLIAIGIVIALFIHARGLESERQRAEFAQRARMISDALDKHLASHVEALHSLAVLMRTTEQLDAERFRAYVTGALDRHDGLYALSWNPRVTDQNRKRFEASMIAAGHTGFSITEYNAHGALQPAARRADYVVVQFIEPQADNSAAQGFDAYSNPLHQRVLDAARDLGEARATGRIRLVQESGEQNGLLLFLPVYAGERPAVSLLQRRRELLGYAVGVFRMHDLLVSAATDLALENLNVSLSDQSAAVADRTLAAVHIGAMGNATELDQPIAEDMPGWSRGYLFAGRLWRLSVSATPAYLSEHLSLSAWVVLAGGLSFTGLLCVLLLTITGRAISERHQAEELSIANRSLNEEIARRKLVERRLTEAMQRVERLAATDALTGLWNRRHMLQFGAACVAEQMRHGTHYSAILLDVDHFKRINDDYGHDVGDDVLQSLSAALGDALRESDALGRWGGEEFVVLARRTDLAEGIDLAERLCNTVRQLSITPVGHITISVGVAASGGLGGGDRLDDKQPAASHCEVLIARADRAMYHAKRSGRDRICVAVGDGIEELAQPPPTPSLND